MMSRCLLVPIRTPLSLGELNDILLVHRQCFVAVWRTHRYASCLCGASCGSIALHTTLLSVLRTQGLCELLRRFQDLRTLHGRRVTSAGPTEKRSV